jgi:hypothetical protein
MAEYADYQYNPVLSIFYAVNGGKGGGTPTEEEDMIIHIPAGAWDYPASNPAPLDTDSGSNGTIKRQVYDDSTNESTIAQFKLPSDIDTSGTVTFRICGYATTAASAGVVFNFNHNAIGDDESWDGSFSTKASGTLAVGETQDYLNIDSWTETVSNLGWTANDMVRMSLERDTTAGGDTLTGDYGVVYFEVVIPRA